MSSIPTFSAQTNLPRIPQVHVEENASPDSFGAGLGRGLSNAGNEVAQVEDHKRELQKRAVLEADRTAVTAADDQISRWSNDTLFNPDSGALTRQGQQALGVTPKTLDSYDSETARIAGTLSNPRQQAGFLEAARQKRDTLQGQLLRHETTERERFQDTTDASRIATAVQSASLNTDPKEIGLQKQAIDGVLENQKERRGWDNATLDQAKLDNYTKLHSAVIDRYLSNDDFKSARTYFDANRGEMLADHAMQSENAINSRERAAAAEAKANMALAREDIHGQMDDIRAAVQYGQPVTQIPDRKQVLAAFGPERGPKLYQSALDLQRLSVKAQDLNQMTTDEIQSAVKAESPKGQDGAAEQANVFQTYDKLAQQVLKERKQNPVQYLQQVSPVVTKTTQDLAQNVEGSGEQYFHTIEAEKARLGITSPDVFAPNLPPGGSEWQRAALLATDKYKQVPKDASVWARSALRSQDPKVVASAAGFLDAVNNAVPGAYDEMRGADKGYAGLVSQMVNAGAAPDRAVQVAQEVTSAPPDVIKQRSAEYRKLAPSNLGKLNSFLDEFDPGIFSFQPNASVQLQGDFDRQTATYFKQTGDIDLARKLSWSDLRRVYGPTKVNGDNSSDARTHGFEVQAFPVERFGVDPKDVRSEIADTLKQYPQSDGSKPEDVSLVADADTMREVDNALDGKKIRPSYRLLTKTGDYVRNDQGLPVRYFLPSEEDTLKLLQKKQAEIDTQNQQTVNDARWRRGLNKEVDTMRKTSPILR